MTRGPTHRQDAAVHLRWWRKRGEGLSLWPAFFVTDCLTVRDPGDARVLTGRNLAMPTRVLVAVLFALFGANPSQAAQCGGDFKAFLAAMGREAQVQGVSRAVIDQSFA